MKSDTHSGRSEKLSKAKHVLASFCDRGKIDSNELTADDCNESMKWTKNIVIPNKCMLNMIIDWIKEIGANCACALHEAEWQCAHV